MSSLLSSGKSYTYTSGKEPSTPYLDTNTLEATDGDYGSATFTDAEWFGFLSDGINGGTGLMEFTIDLEDTYTLDYVRFNFWSGGNFPNEGIVAPETVVIYGSTNGTDFTQLDSFGYSGNWNVSSATPAFSNNLTVTGNYRYVRFSMIAFEAVGGYKNWTFISEAEVYGDALPTTVYSKGNEVTLPADDTTLTEYTAGEITNVATDDTDYATLTSTVDGYAVHLFKQLNALEAQSKFNVTVIAKSDIATSTSTVYLQVYNRTTAEWETLDTDSATNAGTEFTLTGSVTTSLSDYFDVNYIVSVRIYQEL